VRTTSMEITDSCLILHCTICMVWLHARSIVTHVCIPSHQGSYYTWKRTCVVSASRARAHGVEHPNSDDVLRNGVNINRCQRADYRVQDQGAFGEEIPRYPGRTYVPSNRLWSPLPLRFEIQHSEKVQPRLVGKVHVRYQHVPTLEHVVCDLYSDGVSNVYRR